MRKAFTFVEVMIALVIVAIVTTVALVPTSSLDVQQANAAGHMFSALVEYGQNMAITRTDQVYQLKVDKPGNRFWLATAAAPDTPLTNPITKAPCLVQLGTLSPDGLKTVTIKNYDFGGDAVVKFDTSGALDQSTPAQIEFGVKTSSFTVALSPITGVPAFKVGKLSMQAAQAFE